MNYIRKDLDINTVVGSLLGNPLDGLLVRTYNDDWIVVPESSWMSTMDFHEWCGWEYDKHLDEGEPKVWDRRFYDFQEKRRGDIILSHQGSGEISFILPFDDFEITTYGVSSVYNEVELGPEYLPDDDEWDKTVLKETGIKIPTKIIRPFSNYIFWDILSNDNYTEKGYPYLRDDYLEDYNNGRNRRPYYIFWGKTDIYVGEIHATIQGVKNHFSKHQSLFEKIMSIALYVQEFDEKKEIESFSIVLNDCVSQPPGKDHHYREYKEYKHVQDKYVDTLFPHDEIDVESYSDCIIPTTVCHGEQRKYIEEEEELKANARIKYSKENHFAFLVKSCIWEYDRAQREIESVFYGKFKNIISYYSFAKKIIPIFEEYKNSLTYHIPGSFTKEDVPK